MNVWAKIPSGQSSTVRYTMEELMNIWDDANDPHWDAIRLQALAMNGNDPFNPKYLQFFNRADEAKVNH